MDQCFSCLQLIFLFVITGSFSRYFYICLFRLLIVSTHLGITWPNDIIWITLKIYFSIRCYCKKEIKSTSVLKSDNDSSGFSMQTASMQSFKLESHVNVSVRLGVIYHLTSNLNLFLLLKMRRFRRLHRNRKSVACRCCKPPPYTFWESCTFGEMRGDARKLLWMKENSHWWQVSINNF